MPHQMIPSVEKRVSSWIEIQKRITSQDLSTTPPKTTITVSREFGCEGYPLVAELSSRLSSLTGQEWTIFDNKFVDKLLEDNEISKHLMNSFGDRAKYLDYIISTLLPTWKSEAEAFKPMVEAIYSIARLGNAIILERGAFAITKDLPNCYHFRLIAPLEYRISSFARRVGTNEEEARAIVAEKELVRTRFLSDFLNCSFNQESFHLVYNNAKMSTEKIAESILHFLGY